MQLFVEYEEKTLSSITPSEPYGDWSAEKVFFVKAVTKNRPETWKYEAFEVDFELNEGDSLHVLSMIYSSGDSFGSSSGNGEVLWVFKDKELANLVAKKFDNTKKESIEFTNESGKKIKLSNPAAGYFENMSSINVDSFVLD